ncbi:hypothetical protein [Candidatus Nitrospira bockiana]
MKTYKGIVKGNTVVLKDKLDVVDGTEALVLVKATEEEEQDIVNRQKAMLEAGFAMGKLRYRKREELHERG